MKNVGDLGRLISSMWQQISQRLGAGPEPMDAETSTGGTDQTAQNYRESAKRAVYSRSVRLATEKQTMGKETLSWGW